MATANLQFAEPQQEAAFFYGLFLRGHPLQKLREDIDVPPHVLERWQRLAEHDPMYHGMLDRMLTYRKHVLAIFETLVFREMLVPLERNEIIGSLSHRVIGSLWHLSFVDGPLYAARDSRKSQVDGH